MNRPKIYPLLIIFIFLVKNIFIHILINKRNTIIDITIVKIAVFFICGLTLLMYFFSNSLLSQLIHKSIQLTNVNIVNNGI